MKVVQLCKAKFSPKANITQPLNEITTKTYGKRFGLVESIFEKRKKIAFQRKAIIKKQAIEAILLESVINCPVYERVL
jgi:hypothetical protein